MNSNKNESNNIKNIKVLQFLLEYKSEAQLLKNDLIELLANYSRQLILHYDKQNGEDICPLGEPDRQIYGLMQVIAMLDAESERPLFSDTHLAKFTSEENTSSSAA